MTAHTQSCPWRAMAGLARASLLSLALPAVAVGLGDLQVHSSLGEPLDATVALVMAPGTTLRPECFSVGRARADGLPGVPRAAFSVEPDGASWRVRIRTRVAIHEPALQLRLKASCEGKDAASRDYEILLDPRPQAGPVPPLRALPGDTLASLASAIYPKRRAVRDAYVRALRAANPALSKLSDDAPIPPGTEIGLPDLRRFSMSLAASPPAARAPAVAPPDTPPKAAAPAPATAPPRKDSPRPAVAQRTATPKPPPAARKADAPVTPAGAQGIDSPKPQPAPPASPGPRATNSCSGCRRRKST